MEDKEVSEELRLELENATLELIQIREANQ